MARQRFPIHRTRIGPDIVAEFSIPPTAALRKKGRVAILGKGVPTMPGSSAVLEFFARKGFHTILPRYRGTWESGGTFLEHEPTDDLDEVLNALPEPLLSMYEGKKYMLPQKGGIYLFVGSFGGPAGMFLSKDPRVTRVFAHSSVVDWRIPMKKEPVKGFSQMIKWFYGEGYRIDPRGEQKLLSGTFYNPATAPYEIEPNKVHLFHAKDDEIVPYDSVARFAKHTGIMLTSFARGGHGGTSSFMDTHVWKHVMKEVMKQK